MTTSDKLSQPEQASADGLQYIKPKLNEMQAGILAMLQQRGFHGATDSEVAHYLGIGDNARKRRGELCKQGLVVPSERKRPACDSCGRETGPTQQTVWVAREYSPAHKHESKDLAQLEQAIKDLMTEARRIKRKLRKADRTPDAIYSLHERLTQAHAAYSTTFWKAWESIKMQECPECEGMGEYEAWCDAADGRGEHTTHHWIQTCETCNGEGEVEYE